MAVVKVPVIGNVKSSWLYAGGAAVAGIVGYAWWTGAGAEEEIPVEGELPVTDYEPPTVVDSGISTGNVTPTPGIAATNVEWASMAREQAAALGFSEVLTAAALTKYLGKTPLTKSEASLIRAVVQILGQPPSGGPYPITEAIPTPTPTPTPTPKPTAKPGAPASVSAKGGRARIVISWSAVKGAESYEVRLIKGYPAGEGLPWRNVGSQTSHTSIQRVRKTTTYSVEVRARNKAGVGPAKRVGPVKVIP